MPYNTVVTFSAGNPLAAADLNNNFANLDYLNAKINAEIQISAGSMVPRAVSGASPASYASPTYSHNFAFLDYADGTPTYADFYFVLPSDYNSGTITYRVLWTANSTSTNSVLWILRGSSMTDDGALDAPFGTSVGVVDANKSTAYNLNISDESAPLTIAGSPAPRKLAFFSLHRDPTHGSDTLAATARLLAVVLTYTRA